MMLRRQGKEGSNEKEGRGDEDDEKRDDVVGREDEEEDEDETLSKKISFFPADRSSWPCCLSSRCSMSIRLGD